MAGRYRLTGAGRLPEYLKQLRRWLSDRGCKPAAFLYDVVGLERIVRVGFELGDEAEAFAAQFGGKISRSAS